jgi:hypothetical protein
MLLLGEQTARIYRRKLLRARLHSQVRLTVSVTWAYSSGKERIPQRILRPERREIRKKRWRCSACPHTLRSPPIRSLETSWSVNIQLPSVTVRVRDKLNGHMVSVLVIDNARCHRSDRIEKTSSDAEVKLVYLPPHSPDLNPTKELFSEISIH